MADDLENTLHQNASGPRRTRGDSSEMEQYSLPEHIEAESYPHNPDLPTPDR